MHSTDDDKALPTRRPVSARLLRGLAWALITTALWVVLSRNAGWYIGIPAVALATAVALLLDTRPWTIRPWLLPRCGLFFIRASLIGGWDVARRTLSPAAPMTPGWVLYPLRTRDPGVRLALSAIVGLLPGTLSSGIEGEQMHVHLLDRQGDWRPMVERLEYELHALSGQSGFDQESSA